jgi:hypothetical protein
MARASRAVQRQGAIYLLQNANGITGRPDPEHISTPYVERQNLTMLLSTRRFTRPTNGFSKKHHVLRNGRLVFFSFYNFQRQKADISHHILERRRKSSAC